MEKREKKERGRKTNKGREGTKRPPLVFLKRSPKEAVEVKEFRILTGR
jgi:hypothetical protein